MAKRLISIFFCVLASPAFAQMPPPKWDHPFSGKMIEHLVPYGKAAALCRELNPEGDHPNMVSGRKLYGCAFWRGETCEIVYSYDPTGLDKRMASNVFRHERAHCNGWPSDHPGALP